MISTHILDTSLGTAAAGVLVVLEKKAGENWDRIGVEETNADGRIAFDSPYEPGTYRLLFQTEAYLTKKGVTAFFPLVPVTFKVVDVSRKYHIPLLLNPYGYSTYRGT